VPKLVKKARSGVPGGALSMVREKATTCPPSISS
jgi:hypothetical protein